MKFEKGKFYKASYREYGVTITKYEYCIDIRNENEGTEYKPFYVAQIYDIGGEGKSIICNKDGEADSKDVFGHYEEIADSEFAAVLLEHALQGHEYLSHAVSRYNYRQKEIKDERAAKNLPDFFGLGPGNDED